MQAGVGGCEWALTGASGHEGVSEMFLHSHQLRVQKGQFFQLQQVVF